MKKRIINILQYIFFLGLGLLFVWLSVKDIHHAQWLQIKDALQRARLWLIPPSIIVVFLAHYVRALRWRILMEPLGYHPSRFNVFASVMIGYLVNAGVPRLGEVVKCSLLARYEKVRVDKLIGTIVMERAVDVVCLLLVFLSALYFEGQVINEHIFARFTKLFQNNDGQTSFTKLFLILGILFSVVLTFYLLLKRFGHIDAVAKIRGVLSGILHGLISIRLIQHKGWFLIHTFSMWALYLAGTTIGIYALQETSVLGVGGGLTALALGSIGMIIAPGGIGAYAWIIATLIGWYGLNEVTIGNALGWLLWSVQTLVILVGGLICFALLSYFNKNREQTTISPITE